MRRRRVQNPWPALADLMTVLAAVGLFVSAAVLSDPEKLREKLEGLRIENESLKVEIQAARHERDDLLSIKQELAKNRLMFDSIQAAEDMVGTLKTALQLPADQWGDDQSLRFGDDLIHFDTDDFEVRWQLDSRERMRTFCDTLAHELAKPFREGVPRAEVFTLVVEGHTDSVRCGGSDDCNWFLSAKRAASVRIQMVRPDVCPGGDRWTIQPMGLAATRPLVAEADDLTRGKNRRIQLRLAPNYGRLVELSQQTEGAPPQ